MEESLSLFLSSKYTINHSRDVVYANDSNSQQTDYTTKLHQDIQYAWIAKVRGGGRGLGENNTVAPPPPAPPSPRPHDMGSRGGVVVSIIIIIARKVVSVMFFLH